ncbi:MAG TPA: hypothetical protein VGN42_16155 [Pirellulales bacterium]|nr:hypothetical protein [Pirellulales bacterium]
MDPEGLGLSPDYRPISTMAVVGLLAGLASVLAFTHPLFWAVPALGALLSGCALHQLAVAVPPRIGRRAALIGLTLSLLCGASAITRQVLFRWQLRAETMQAGKQWFEALREGDPYKAHQFTLGLGKRLEPGDDLVVRYSEPHARKGIEEYVEKPAIRLLLSLGPYAQVRYYETTGLVAVPETAGATHRYAVSVSQDGKITSCFIELHWSRIFDYDHHDWQWKLSSAEVVTRPLAPWTAAADVPAL